VCSVWYNGGCIGKTHDDLREGASSMFGKLRDESLYLVALVVDSWVTSMRNSRRCTGM
jgi:hypothetical protein